MKALITLISTFLIAIPLTSCATDGKHYPGDTPQTGLVKQAFYFIDTKGNLQAVDKDGSPVELKRVKFPFEHPITKINSVKQLTIIEIEGSHFELICPAPQICFQRVIGH